MTDLTLKSESLFGSTAWAATAMGMHTSTFRQKRPDLIAEGFPTPDSLTGHYIKADVIEWVNQRRQITNKNVMSGGLPTGGPNLENV